MCRVALIAFTLLLTVAHATIDVKVGMFYRAKMRPSPTQMMYLFPAAEIAFETVAKRGDYKNLNLSFVSTDACCSRPVRSTGALAASFYYDDGVDAFLGPAWSSDMIAVADMAAHWNLPVVSGISTSSLLDDKTRFATLTRTSPGIDMMVKSLSAIMEHLGVQECVVLRGLPGSNYYYRKLVPDAIYTALEAKALIVHEVYADQFNTLDRALCHAASISKVIFISASPVRDIMIHAHRLGYTKGSHVFLNWYPSDFVAWKTSSQFDDLDQEAKEALKALVIMRMQVPDTKKYHAFQKKLRARQRATYGKQEKEENFYAAAWHDAVLIYAEVINEIVAEGGNVRDGRAVTQKMWDRTFDQGATGPVHINKKGDRDGVCELLVMKDSDKGKFRVGCTFDEATNVLNVDHLEWL